MVYQELYKTGDKTLDKLREQVAILQRKLKPLNDERYKVGQEMQELKDKIVHRKKELSRLSDNSG